MITNCKDPIESIIILLISSLGFLSITKHIISFTRWTLVYFLRPSKNLPVLYGPWAIVTGSTDGIGKAIAFELAQKGLNLILVSRDSVKLAQVTQEIEERVPGRSVKSLVIDFSDEERFPDVGKVLEQFIEALEVGVVVNNVGVTYPKAMYFHEVEEEVWKRIVRVNLEGTTRVTVAVLKGMMKRRRGAIVNVSSGAGIVVPSHPLFAVYAATKAYIDEFSRRLNKEYKGYGIDVQCQVPLYVATKMVSRVTNSDEKLPSPSLFTPTPRDYAKAAVARIGYEPRCTPYWTHSFQWFVANLIPDSLLDAWRLSIGVRRRNKAHSYEPYILPSSGPSSATTPFAAPKPLWLYI